MTPLRLVLVVLAAAVVAAANIAIVRALGPSAPCASCAGWLVGAPFALALFIGLLPRPAAMALPAPARSASPPAEVADAAALGLLADLQREGRLVDFLEEDLGPYPDEQIGAAVRAIHEGCRKALHARVELEPVLQAAEGDAVTLEAGFAPEAVRLTGNVGTTPPFRGVVRHAGWRAKRVALPAGAGADARVIAPAEVEIA